MLSSGLISFKNSNESCLWRNPSSRGGKSGDVMDDIDAMIGVNGLLEYKEELPILELLGATTCTCVFRRLPRDINRPVSSSALDESAGGISVIGAITGEATRPKLAY